jgi:hypothetical protein
MTDGKDLRLVQYTGYQAVDEMMARVAMRTQAAILTNTKRDKEGNGYLDLDAINKAMFDISVMMQREQERARDILDLALARTEVVAAQEPDR